MELAVAVFLGIVVVGLIIALVLVLARRQVAPQADMALVIQQVSSATKDILAGHSQAQTDYLLNMAEQRLGKESQAQANELENKKELIDLQLKEMKDRLESVRHLLEVIEKDKFSTLGTQLVGLGRQTDALTSTTNALREALVNSRARGQWGERMAEDILRLIGLEEKVNYIKQSTQAIGGRPDFTFLLPGNLRMNMDVKFPLDNYLRALEAGSEVERQGFERSFLNDVRGHIRTVSGRAYIDPEGGTVDYVLLFIPNEGVYAAIHQMDATILEEGLRSRVICCSPFTLFAVLAVVRQAINIFNLQKASDEIVALMGRFYAEWSKFKGSMDQVGQRLESTQQAYIQATGVRTRTLERPLEQIESLRRSHGLPIASAEAVTDHHVFEPALLPPEQAAVAPMGIGSTATAYSNNEPGTVPSTPRVPLHEERQATHRPFTAGGQSLTVNDKPYPTAAAAKRALLPHLSAAMTRHAIIKALKQDGNRVEEESP